MPLFASVSAQTPYPQCSASGSSPLHRQDINVCNAAVDGAEIFHPVAGLLVSGGNPVLGSIGTLGGFGHFALTARVNATELKTPDLNYDGSGGTTVAQGDKIFAPAPLVEAAVGVFKGVGPSGFSAIDLLGSAQLLPTNQVERPHGRQERPQDRQRSRSGSATARGWASSAARRSSPR